ncbi:hypothetical protein [Bradyrhizobium centrosematis]|uniref:hypothetical protein n=1 Tax=Bradyrhizobium centrosematis TaxID=1300039 RepID=UPI00388D52C8
MNVRKNARLTPKGRELLMRSVLWTQPNRQLTSPTQRLRPIAKWVKPVRAGVVDGCTMLLQLPLTAKPNFSNHMHSCRGRAPQRHTGKQIAADVKVSPGHRQPHSYSFGIEPDAQWSRLPRDPAVSARARRDYSYGHQKIGVSSVGHRITGDASGCEQKPWRWLDFVHACIVDHSRCASSEIKPDEAEDSAFFCQGSPATKAIELRFG